MKKIAYVLTIIGLLLIINGFFHSIYDLWHKQDLVESAKKELSFETEKNQKLKAQLQYAQTPEFLEEQAHDKLFMQKPGEQTVIFSQVPQVESSKKAVNIPNWQQWLNLFL